MDPNPEALMAAAAALAAGKLPRAAGTRGVRKTPVKKKWLSRGLLSLFLLFSGQLELK